MKVLFTELLEKNDLTEADLPAKYRKMISNYRKFDAALNGQDESTMKASEKRQLEKERNLLMEANDEIVEAINEWLKIPKEQRDAARLKGQQLAAARGKNGKTNAAPAANGTAAATATPAPDPLPVPAATPTATNGSPATAAILPSNGLPTHQPTVTQDPPKKNNKGVYVVLGILTLVLGALAGAAFYQNRQENTI